MYVCIYMSCSLTETLEFAEDLEVDIPKMWDFIGEIICPVVTSSQLSLIEYCGLFNEARISHCAAKGMAK